MKKGPTVPIEDDIRIFQQFLEASGQGMTLTDREGKLVYMNAALCRLLGEAKPEDACGKNVLTYYPPESVRRVREDVLPMVERKGRWIGELTIIGGNGRPTPVIENIFLIRDAAEKPVYFARLITDIAQIGDVKKQIGSYRGHLEEQVRERTAELEKSNILLQMQIGERRRVEEALRKSELFLHLS